MSIETGGISMSVPSIGPSIGPAISTGPSFGGSAPAMDIGPAMGFGPTVSVVEFSPFSIVNEGPAPIDSWESFSPLRPRSETSPLIPSTPDLGGTIGPIEALNSTIPIAEPKPFSTIVNEGPVSIESLNNTRLFGAENYSYRSDRMGITVGLIKNPFLELGTRNLELEMFVTQPVTPMFEPAPAEEVFTSSPLEFGISDLVELVTPKKITIGVAEPLKEHDTEVEEELEMVRAVINQQMKQLNTSVQRFESVSPLPRIQPQIKQESIVLKAIEEKQEKINSNSKEKQDNNFLKRRLVKDGKALSRRIIDGLKAVQMAFEQARVVGKKSVKGVDVKALIPDEYGEVRSEVLNQDKKDGLPDGSYIFEGSGIREIEETSSIEHMQSKVVSVVNNNIPVRRSENEHGEAVTPNDVLKVYMGRKRPQIVQISETPGPIMVEETIERRVEDDDKLREIFKVAA